MHAVFISIFVTNPIFKTQLPYFCVKILNRFATEAHVKNYVHDFMLLHCPEAGDYKSNFENEHLLTFSIAG